MSLPFGALMMISYEVTQYDMDSIVLVSSSGSFFLFFCQHVRANSS